MKKTVPVLCVLLGVVLLVAGCYTAKGAVEGVAGGLVNTTSGTAEGIAKDAGGFWDSLKKADDWVRKNLW